MRPEGDFIGRPQARHCDALRARMRPPVTAVVEAPAFPAERFARELSVRLTRLMSGISPRIACGAPDTCSARALGERLGAFAANTLFTAGPGAMPLSVSIGADAVLRLLDRTFGGRGEPIAPLPHAFPLSAELLIERIEAIVSEALAHVFDAPATMLRRHADFAVLAPFAADEPLALHEITVSASDAASSDWTLLVAYPPARYAAADDGNAAQTLARHGASSDARLAPYAEIPLTLSAVLVDMRMPLARLASLKVGDVLPVSIARNVPITAGGKRIGAGAIGSFDDRTALRLTETF